MLHFPLQDRRQTLKTQTMTWQQQAWAEESGIKSFLGVYLFEGKIKKNPGSRFLLSVSDCWLVMRHQAVRWRRKHQLNMPALTQCLLLRCWRQTPQRSREVFNLPAPPAPTFHNEQEEQEGVRLWPHLDTISRFQHPGVWLYQNNRHHTHAGLCCQAQKQHLPLPEKIKGR